MSKKTKQAAPDHLQANTQQWWHEVVSNFELESHHLKLLTMAAEAWDRCCEARRTIAEEGTYYRDRFNCPHAHPAVAIERDSRIAFARLLRELDLDVEPPSGPRRPPNLPRYEVR